MPTRRGWGMLAAAFLASLGARGFGSSELALAGQAALLLVVLAVVLVRVSSARLEVRRHKLPRRLFFDAEGDVELIVRNRGRLPTPAIQIVDRAPDHLASANRFLLSPMHGGRTAVLRHRIRGRKRGVHQVGPTQVHLRDPFGLAARRVTIDNAEKVVVYPPVWQLPPDLPLGSALSSARGRTRPAPQGGDFAGVRQYTLGDDLRQVHWRTTARRGELYVRQHEAPWRPEGTVLIDPRPTTHGGPATGPALEAAVAAAASAVHHLSDRGLQVRLVIEGEDLTAPERPWELTLERLAELRGRDDVDLSAMLRRMANGDGLGTLVVILGVPSTMELRLLVRAGRAYGTRAALLVDAPAFSGRDSNVGPTRTALMTAGWRVGILGPGTRVDHAWSLMATQRPGVRVGIT
ncbi:MAG: DUF58 domain-containing protein [Nitriliruptorales bacterium]|nr:DUF58 domain-containing protein [Nitriliruptorales bacterium]